MWFAWLGWDHEYHLVDGVLQGPYREWQVVGCGLCIAAASMVASLRVRGTISVLVLAGAADLGVAVPWAVDAARVDDSGLWGVGLVLLLAGCGSGVAVLLAATNALAGPGARAGVTSWGALC